MRRPAPPRTRDYYDWLQASPTERKARLEEYEDKKKSAHGVESLATSHTASARRNTGYSSRSRNQKAPYMVGFHHRTDRWKIAALLMIQKEVHV